MHQRTLFIADHLRGTRSVTELCAEYGISRKTGYKWIAGCDILNRHGLIRKKPKRRRIGHPGRATGIGGLCPHLQRVWPAATHSQRQRRALRNEFSGALVGFVT
jgi:hypothetical protein